MLFLCQAPLTNNEFRAVSVQKELGHMASSHVPQWMSVSESLGACRFFVSFIHKKAIVMFSPP